MSRRVLWFVAVAGVVALAAVVAVLLIQERDGPAIEVARCAAIEADSEEPDRPVRDDTDEHVRDDSDALEDSEEPDRADGTPGDDAVAEDHEADPTEEDEESKPYTASNPPRLEDIKDLPIGEPRKPKAPEYASNLEDDDWQLYDTTPGIDHRRKIWPNKWPVTNDAPTRRIRGRVYEIVGSERIPLSDVLVVGWKSSSTFTDEEGRFDFVVNVGEPPDADKMQGHEYYVMIFAHAHGYIDIKRGGTYSNLDEGEDGFELYVVRRDSRRIRVSIDNPQATGNPVTVVLSRRDSGPSERAMGFDWDERRFIVAQMDAREEAWFSVPRRFPSPLGESDFELMSVSAPNILANVKAMSPVSRSNEEIVYNVRLVVEDTVTVRGIVADMRTGLPLAAAHISGPGATEFTVADAQGRFELITAREPRGPEGEPVPENERFLYIAREGYAPIRTLIKNRTLTATATGGISPEGGNLAGPWKFRLRPFVSVEIDGTELHEAIQEGGSVSLPRDVIATSRFYVGSGWWGFKDAGIREAAFFPWGMEQLELHPPGRRHLKPGVRPHDLPRDPVKIPAHCWQGDEPYRLKLAH